MTGMCLSPITLCDVSRRPHAEARRKGCVAATLVNDHFPEMKTEIRLAQPFGLVPDRFER
jgi:hypothetical protein